METGFSSVTPQGCSDLLILSCTSGAFWVSIYITFYCWCKMKILQPSSCLQCCFSVKPLSFMFSVVCFWEQMPLTRHTAPYKVCSVFPQILPLTLSKSLVTSSFSVSFCLQALGKAMSQGHIDDLWTYWCSDSWFLFRRRSASRMTEPEWMCSWVCDLCSGGMAKPYGNWFNLLHHINDKDKVLFKLYFTTLYLQLSLTQLFYLLLEATLKGCNCQSNRAEG